MTKRIFTAFKADVIFQIKQGFYFVYILLALLYLILLSQFDMSVVKIMLPIIVYIDPSVLGLFFIGGITMLEKEQGILALIYVTPLRMWEYMLSKLASLTVLSLTVAIVITFISYNGSVNYFLLIAAILLTSTFYTLVGFIIATKSKSVNAFFMKMLPPMILMILPCFLLIIKMDLVLLNFIPSIATLKLVLGAYMNIQSIDIIISLVWMVLLDILLLIKAKDVFKNHMILEA